MDARCGAEGLYLSRSKAKQQKYTSSVSAQFVPLLYLAVSEAVCFLHFDS